MAGNKTLMTSGIDANNLFSSYDITEQEEEIVQTHVYKVDKAYKVSPEEAEIEKSLDAMSTEEIEAYFLATRESALATSRKANRFFKFSVGLAACKQNFEPLRKLDKALTTLPPLQKAMRSACKIATDGFISITRKGLINAPVGEAATKSCKAAYLQWQNARINPLDQKRMNEYQKNSCYQIAAKKAESKASKDKEVDAKRKALIQDLHNLNLDDNTIHSILVAVERYEK